MDCPGFLLFGVPRSGTRALAEALNLDPGLFCTHERRLALAPPRPAEAVMAEIAGYAGDQRAMLAEQAALAAKRATGRALRIGDRLPNAFLHWDRVAALHPGLPALCLMRDMAEVATSWDRRAADAADSGWHRGQIGIFALLDWALLLGVLAGPARGATLASHGALFLDRDWVVKDCVRAVAGREADAAVRPAFNRTLFRRVQNSPRDARYPPLLDAIGATALEARLRKLGACPVEEVAPLMAAARDAALPALAAFHARTIEAADPAQRQAIGAFTAAWAERRRHLGLPTGLDPGTASH